MKMDEGKNMCLRIMQRFISSAIHLYTPVYDSTNNLNNKKIQPLDLAFVICYQITI